MRIDLYTKALLTVIAVLLAVTAFKQFNQPQPVAAEGNFSGVQFSGMSFFDTRTGDIWSYGQAGMVVSQYKLIRLGEPLQVIKAPQ